MASLISNAQRSNQNQSITANPDIIEQFESAPVVDIKVQEADDKLQIQKGDTNQQGDNQFAQKQDDEDINNQNLQPKLMISNLPVTRNIQDRPINDKQQRINIQQSSNSLAQVNSNQINVQYQPKSKVGSPKKHLRIILFDQKGQLQSKNTLDPAQLEAKIKQIAKQIREKVKKGSPKHGISDTCNDKIENKSNRVRYRKQIILQPLQKHYTFNHLTSPQTEIQPGQSAEYQMKELIKKDILSKVWKQIELRSKITNNKIKLDPIKHKYPITSFRKVILSQKQIMNGMVLKRMKVKEELLLKRRQIYNNSRYERYAKQYKKNKSLEHTNPITYVMLKERSQHEQEKGKQEYLKEYQINQESAQHRQTDNPQCKILNKQQMVSPLQIIAANTDQHKVDQTYHEEYDNQQQFNDYF